jgi:hypothetical protein
MIRNRILLLLLLVSTSVFSQKRKVFTATPVYDSIIATYKALDRKSPIAKLEEKGYTDIGRRLHLFILSRDSTFNPVTAKAKGKVVILVNNGIHPGEPDGIDASIELARAYIANPELLPPNVVLCIIPVYNIDGCLNRGDCSRANQCGPVEYGFRGNAKNLDLNRDFVKCDAANTLSFEMIFNEWKPDVLIDTHVSDGADYQYTMTLIATQRNKLNPVLSAYMDKELVPSLYASMDKIHQPMSPYVETRGETPESGITGFLETPRFSTGYAALFNCIGFVTETHMLKPFSDRVWATYDLLNIMVAKIGADGTKIVSLRAEADKKTISQRTFVLDWKLDTTQYDVIDFRGYEAKHKTSDVTGLPRLFYDRNSPFTKKIRYYNTYVPTTTVTAPDMYILPYAYPGVLMRLQLNGVKIRRLNKDTLLTVQMYYITNYETGRSPYESHYLHRDVKVRAEAQQVWFRANDYVIDLNQACNRYIVETLEPEGGDSFFAWNFFDGILQQKEWFSDYVFEEKADSILKSNPALRKTLNDQRLADTAFASNGWAQLNFIYQHSAFKEASHNRYPVARIFGEMKLPADDMW